MTITIVAVSVMTFVAAAYLLTDSLKRNRRSKERNRFLQQFQRLGASYNLAFSNYELLNGTMIGLDELQQKLLILKKRGRITGLSKLIDAAEVKNCLLERHYGTVRSKSKSGSKPERRLEKISLRLLLIDNSTEEIVFYNHQANLVMEMTSLANKAKHWEIMLARMQEPKRQIA